MVDESSRPGGEASAQSGYGDVSASEVEKYLSGADFPTDKDGLIECAKGNNAPGEVLDLMDKFPEQEYGDVSDVAKAIGDAKG